MKNLKSLILLFLLVFNLSVCTSQTKEEVFDQLISKIGKLNSIGFSFESMNDKTFSGKLIANNQNQYKLVLPNKIIICDGKSVWNYSSKEKQVLVSNFKKNSSAAIQNIFFKISQNFTPIELLHSAQNKNTILLKLKSKLSDADQIILHLNKKLDIQQINFNYDNSTGDFKIKKFMANPTIQPSELIFVTPKGIDEIDLR